MNAIAFGTASCLSLALLGFVSAAPQTVRKFFSAADPHMQASQSNLHCLAGVVLMYQQDWDEKAPPASQWGTLITPYVAPYVKDTEIFRSPSAKDTNPFRDPAAPVGVKYSYAFNKNLSARTLNVVRVPAKTVLLFDSTKNALNASDTGQSVPRPGRHGGGSLYAFSDGHVRWLPDAAKPSFKLSGK